MITGPMNSPIRPKVCTPPSTPISARRNGSRAERPTSAGHMKLSPMMVTAMPKMNNASTGSAPNPCTSSSSDTSATAISAPSGSIANAIVSSASRIASGAPIST